MKRLVPNFDDGRDLVRFQPTPAVPTDASEHLVDWFGFSRSTTRANTTCPETGLARPITAASRMFSSLLQHVFNLRGIDLLTAHIDDLGFPSENPQPFPINLHGISCVEPSIDIKRGWPVEIPEHG